MAGTGKVRVVCWSYALAGMRHTLSAARPARAGSPSRTTVRYAESRVVEWHSRIALLRRPGLVRCVEARVGTGIAEGCWFLWKGDGIRVAAALRVVGRTGVHLCRYWMSRVKCVWCVGFMNRPGMCHTLSAARPARAGSLS